MKQLPVKPAIKFEDLEKLDIRVGTIEMSEGMVFDIGYANNIIPVLAMPEKPVPNGVCAG